MDVISHNWTIKNFSISVLYSSNSSDIFAGEGYAITEYILRIQTIEVKIYII
jgi:hypothetical protein